ncbi:lipocalin family protein [Polaribacter sp. P097]|uniref:lipocalin family protein n=1 Tax=Polaribacter sp. P097 TaxID=3117398 RepID=UPI002FE24990
MKNINKLLFVMLLLVLACQSTSIKNEDVLGAWIDLSDAKLNFTLLENGVARSDNMETLLYQNWELKGDSLILTMKSIGNGMSSIDKMAYKIEMPNSNKIILFTEYGSNEYLKKE